MSNELKKSYPENIVVSELKAELPVQELLNNTALRLIQTKDVQIKVQSHAKNIIETGINGIISLEMELHSKWGLDGSTGQSRYKLKFENQNTSVESILTSTLVPI